MPRSLLELKLACVVRPKRQLDKARGMNISGVVSGNHKGFFSLRSENFFLEKMGPAEASGAGMVNIGSHDAIRESFLSNARGGSH